MPSSRAAAGAERRTVVGMALASLLSAGASYLAMLLAARFLPDVAANTYLLTFWAALYTCFGVLSGMGTELTRSVAAAGARGTGPRAGLVAVAAGLLVAAVAVCTGPLWQGAVLHTTGGPWVWLLALGVLGYSGQAALCGALGGRTAWRPVIAVISLESVVRIVLVVGAAVAAAGAVGLAAAVCIATFTWVSLLGGSAVRRALTARTDRPAGALAARIGASVTAQACSALLVTGFPTLLSATTSAEAYAPAAPLLLAISLTRAPLLVPLTSLQGYAVAHFVAGGDDAVRPWLRMVGLVAAVGVVGGAVAWLVGPWLMAVLFGAAYRVAGVTLALLTVAAAVLAALTLTGALCQAADRHRLFVSGWLCAAVASVLLLLLPGSLDHRVTLALNAGPAVGLVVLAVGLLGFRQPATARVTGCRPPALTRRAGR